ncbi:MAG: hypothetical protein K2H29_11490 [Oscillospiraceae bacterium]|nr:hypothetical protein [Oscillospiraceae bacterium]
MIEYTKEQIGGKAFHLAHLRSLDVNVPKWIVLSCDFFYRFLGDKRAQYTRLLEEYSEENRQNLVDLIEHTEFSAELQDEIREKIQANFLPEDRLAVRSSAADEDGNRHSFAGMLESYLNVPPDDNVMDCIKKCYISCFSQRVMEYRQKNSMINGSVRMAVILQKMIDADYAGVMFTTNPQTNNLDETYISVVSGIGEQLVSGEKDSSDYVVDCTEMVVCQKLNEAVLPEKTLIEIYRLGQLIEKSYPKRRAQDIEFCIQNEIVYILQCRPITHYYSVDKDQFRTVLDNSNIIESYSGVTTPLTFTFAREVYAKIYRQTLRSFFIDEKAIDEIGSDLDQMLAFYENKIYYRLNSWYKMTALYPGYEKNKKYMENMMGVKTTYHETKVQAKTRLFRIYVSFLRKMLHIKRDSRAFIEKFNRVTLPYYQNSFEGYTNQELLDVYDHLEKEILDDFITPIANDMGTMIFYGILTDKLKKSGPENYEGLLSSILGKQGNIESVRQSTKLIELVQEIKKNPELVRLFEENKTERLTEQLKTYPVWKKIEAYIRQFGPRTMDELKLETVTMLEDPAFLYETIRQYIKMEEFPHTKENGYAENELYAKMDFFSRQLTKILVRLTKFFIRNRESLRLRRTYIYSIVRRIYLAIGRNFEKNGFLANYRDIFYLEKEEITGMIRSDMPDRKLLEKIVLRKQEYENHRKKPVYERMVFCGEVMPENCLPIYSQQEKSGILSGVAGGGGKVIGKVKLVECPTDAHVEGYILMAKRTDPGWTVLFPMVKAIIIERGSVLSHSAVIAREMGITLVVGVRGLTDIVKDGMTVEVDGINGTIEIIGEKNE